MKIETKEIYKCEYCKKLYQIKKACEQHEKGCKKRPDYLRPCHDCKILKKIDAGAYSPYYDATANVKVLFCEAINSCVFPPSVSAKGNAFELPDYTNIEMPKECEHQVSTKLLNY